ncbi:MAG: hypothetical protein ABH868_02470 [bacterium]
MNKIAKIAIVIAAISLITAIISRFTGPIALAPGGINAHGLVSFANTWLLVAIVIILLDKCKK